MISISLPVADHGDIVAALPFFLPVILIIGGILVMRALEQRRDTPESTDE